MRTQDTRASGEAQSKMGLEYRYDNMDNVLRRGNDYGGEAQQEYYVYDKFERLREYSTQRDGETTRAMTWEYSAGGKILEAIDEAAGAPATTKTYEYDPASVHQLLQAGGLRYEYDAMGNVSRRTGTDVPGGNQFLTHNEFDMPRELTSAAGTTILEYTASHERVAKRGPAGGETTLYAGELYECQGTTPSSNAPMDCSEQKYKVYVGAAQVAQFTRGELGELTEQSYIHRDQLGSSAVVTNEGGETRSVRRFEPFGKPLEPLTGESVTSGFTGHEHDAEFGLINMRGRIYDPEVGRFLERDPLARPFWSQGMNPYSYVGNNPLNAVDPSGWDGWVPGSVQITIEWGGGGSGGSDSGGSSDGGQEGAGGGPGAGPGASGGGTDMSGMGPMMGPAGPSGPSGMPTGPQGVTGPCGTSGGMSVDPGMSIDPGMSVDPGMSMDPGTCTMNSPSSAPSGNVNEPGRAVSPGSEARPGGVSVPVGAGLIALPGESTLVDVAWGLLRAMALGLSEAATVPVAVAAGAAMGLLATHDARDSAAVGPAKVGQALRPEAGYLGSKKHGIKWKEGQALAKNTGKSQGQWGSKADLDHAGEQAATLKPGEGRFFDLPEGHSSVVHRPDGTTVPAKRIWVRNNGTGTFHGAPWE